MVFIDSIGRFLVVGVREKSAFEEWSKGGIQRSSGTTRFGFKSVSRELRKEPRTATQDVSTSISE
ncbi:hypothetical protein C488_20422 [Natrinema pellirubrum DSM 15624]|uniref:Uncharacterized protein n=1 Tax=Natrinema pellirubrum (strain DSM 15624 / CIP 106293 / JCM 10476 / NCIMB 786 / 157) TaxID=797303 RepID=L9Y6E0_NATP1|nr:hypothetical protein C488_20422 [Natrinema pellirubrum DSM 15624]